MFYWASDKRACYFFLEICPQIIDCRGNTQKSHVLLLKNSVGVGNAGFRIKQAFVMKQTNLSRIGRLSDKTCPYYRDLTIQAARYPVCVCARARAYVRA